MSDLELLAWVVLTPLALTYIVAAPGLIYLRRRGLVEKSSWVLPLAALTLWWLLYALGFGHPEAYNVIELMIISVVVAAGIDLCAVLVMPRVGVTRWSDLLFWGAPLVFVVLLRLVMPPFGE